MNPETLTNTIIHTYLVTGTATPDRVRTYSYIPFEVLPGTRRIEIAYQYSDKISSDPHLTNGNTVDLGVIDARGKNFGDLGLRGWSGSDRDSCFITADNATPSYLPGELQPGTWYVFLGFYKVVAHGCNYEVTIKLFQDVIPSAEKIVEKPYLPLAGQAFQAQRRVDGWYRGELHCHTVHSDGDSSVEDVIREALRLGLDFLAITDHNGTSQQQDMLTFQMEHKPNITLIPGCEMTTYYGHWNAWGLTDWVEFRIENRDQMRFAMQTAAHRGALVSCNHPRDLGPQWEIRDVQDYSCLEIWNGPWALNNWQCLAYWDEQLRAGRRVVAVGGSDMHKLKGTRREFIRLGVPTNWMYSPEGSDATQILEALRQGHNYVTESPDGPQLRFHVNEAFMGDTTARDATAVVHVEVINGNGNYLKLIGASGKRYECQVQSDTFSLDITLDCQTETFLRAQLEESASISTSAEDHPIVRAITNPVYFE